MRKIDKLKSRIEQGLKRIERKKKSKCKERHLSSSFKCGRRESQAGVLRSQRRVLGMKEASNAIIRAALI